MSPAQGITVYLKGADNDDISTVQGVIESNQRAGVSEIEIGITFFPNTAPTRGRFPIFPLFPKECSHISYGRRVSFLSTRAIRKPSTLLTFFEVIPRFHILQSNQHQQFLTLHALYLSSRALL